MSPQTKILIAVVAVTGFVVGIALNRPSIEATSELSGDLSSLLSAELLSVEPGRDDISLTVKSQLDRLTMINFWATWCTPCRQEMPLFESMYQLHQTNGFNVIGIALDSASKAQPFLDSMDISYPILYAEQTGMVIMEENGNPAQLLPYTLLVDKNGSVLEQKIGQVHEQDISAWIKTYLK